MSTGPNDFHHLCERSITHQSSYPICSKILLLSHLLIGCNRPVISYFILNILSGHLELSGLRLYPRYPFLSLPRPGEINSKNARSSHYHSLCHYWPHRRGAGHPATQQRGFGHLLLRLRRNAPGGRPGRVWGRCRRAHHHRAHARV